MPSGRSFVGLIVMTFFAASMVAAKPMGVPLAFVDFSVRMAERSALASAVPLASLRSASAKVRVMSVPAFPTVAPFAGLNAGAATSSSVMVPVASRVEPPPLSVALVGEDSCSTTVSLSSSTSSPVTVTETVLLVSPAAKASVPEVSAW